MTARLSAGPLLRTLALLCLTLCGLATAAPPAGEAGMAVPLVIGHRTVHTFRAPLGAFSAADRADNAKQRILQAFAEGGQGWTSVRAQELGVLVELDGKPMFIVVAGDAPPLAEERADQLANHASRMLQTAWREARERSDPRVNLGAALRVLLAGVVAAVVLVVLWRITRWVRDAVVRALARRVGALPDAALASRMSPIFLGIASRAVVLLAWLLSLMLAYMLVAYALDQFAHTRALGEGLFHAFAELALQVLASVATALPGLFLAVLIFLVAWICTQVSTELFDHVAAGRLKLGLLDAHTAPATRHIVNACLWLFALAMAYPYLPGAQTEAFKGLSVLLGIMVSIGASGLVGQIASGVILVYTRALSIGEYVRIQDCEGTVTEIGLFVTRLRTGMGSEYALPNSLVIGNITRNFSRVTGGTGFVLEAPVSIGYDTPWRQVHALLIGAAGSVPGIAKDPAPYVMQTDLADAYVVYRLVCVVAESAATSRAAVASALNGAIQDWFNRHGVQIMSPSYYDDPAEPKIVPESRWYTPPASRPDAG